MTAGRGEPLDMSNAEAICMAALLAGAPVWRRARDGDDLVLPSLCAALAPLQLTLLAPAVDSIMTLGEACFRRRLCDGARAKDDTDLLCRLAATPTRTHEAVDGADGPVEALICALESIRILSHLSLHR